MTILARYPAPNPLSIFTTDTPLAPSVHDHKDYLCENWCEAEFSSLEYGSTKAALSACRDHKATCGPTTPTVKYREKPVERTLTYKDIKVCTSCGFSEKGIDLMFKTNDPNKVIFVTDL